MKKKLIKLAIKLTPLACFCLIAGALLDYAIIKVTLFALDPTNMSQLAITATVNVPSVRAKEQEMPMKLYVLNEVYKAGLNATEAECIILHESSWINDKISPTKDFGLWQINIIHKTGKYPISLSDMFDYKEATKWSIAKRLRDGNWNAWMGWKKCK